MPTLFRSQIWQILLVLNLLTMLYAFHMHSPLPACIHNVWLATQMGRLHAGNPPFAATSFARFDIQATDLQLRHQLQ